MDTKRMYLAEFECYLNDGKVKFNIVGVTKNEITLAITKEGKISVPTYDLLVDENGQLYFEYGLYYSKIQLDDFEEVS